MFARVVDDGSFTHAAASLGVSKSFASKQVSRLEDRLGVRLLNRTTRRVTITDVGAAFYERVKVLLADLEDAEATVQELHESPRGTLRVSLPVSFGIQYAAPLVAQFLALHPQLAIDVDYLDRRVDILAEGYDMVVRIGKLTDSSLIARKLASSRLHICASPAYLAEHGVPTRPDDLRDHQCLLYRYLGTGHTHTWHFTGPSGQKAVRVTGRMIANSGEAMMDAAIRGLGVVRLPDFIVGNALRRGDLTPILDEWTLDGAGIWALYPHSRHLSAKVRLFVEFLRRSFAEEVPW